MINVQPAFRKWEDGDLQDTLRGEKLVGYQRIRCHLIFDIKMEGKFTRKARFVAGGKTSNLLLHQHTL